MTEKNVGNIILDFDGVVADSFDIFVETLEEVLKRHSLSDEEIESLRGSSTREVIKKLGVKRWQMPKLITQGRHNIAQKMHLVEAFQGMPEAITQAAKDHKLYILSTNDKKGIDNFLDRYGLQNTIEKVYSGIGIFDKAKRLTSLLKHEGLSISSCVYIGDETRDIEAAHKIGMKCIAVEWGYSTPQALKSYHPEAIVAKPNQLGKAVKTLA